MTWTVYLYLPARAGAGNLISLVTSRSCSVIFSMTNSHGEKRGSSALSTTHHSSSLLADGKKGACTGGALPLLPFMWCRVNFTSNVTVSFSHAKSSSCTKWRTSTCTSGSTSSTASTSARCASLKPEVPRFSYAGSNSNFATSSGPMLSHIVRSSSSVRCGSAFLDSSQNVTNPLRKYSLRSKLPFLPAIRLTVSEVTCGSW
mmetsp:Transcript_1236/g.2388  ORF Transcript_1236/g.2388 Transcript_1236/m.2388 type:complete len:202 (-) Transcript_1236:135-740(-)